MSHSRVYYVHGRACDVRGVALKTNISKKHTRKTSDEKCHFYNKAIFSLHKKAMFLLWFP